MHAMVVYTTSPEYAGLLRGSVHVLCDVCCKMRCGIVCWVMEDNLSDRFGA